MQITRLDHNYEIKIDLGDYQTGTAEFYVLATLDGVDVTEGRRALQDMAARNLKFYAPRLQNKPAADISLGLDMPGVTVTKIGVGYGKKVKIGHGHGVSNRSIYHRLWAQILPDDDLERSIRELWGHIIAAYEEKIAAVTPKPKPEKTPPAPKPPTAAGKPPATTPEVIREKVGGLVARYRGKKTAPSGKQRITAVKTLERALDDAGVNVVERNAYIAEIFRLLFDRPTEFDLEARHCSALIRWSNKDHFQTEIQVLVENITPVTEPAWPPPANIKGG